MRRRPGSSSAMAGPSGTEETRAGDDFDGIPRAASPRRSPFVLLSLFGLIMYCSWAVYRCQFESLPAPLTAEQAGKRGFSEVEAMKHVKALTDIGPHHVGSDALDDAIQYVLAASEKIKKIAHWEVDVQVDAFHAQSGTNRLFSGLFRGRTLVYSDLHHIVLKVSPKYVAEAGDAILVSSHIDTVFSAEGAGDCSSCIAVMLELARAVSQWAHGFKSAVIFLFNTGEEEGLNGAHSFITQAGPNPWAIENFALAAKYPSGHVIAQDLFASGAIKSATDFQVYKEVAGLSGLDFAYTDNSAVYHTKNDKLELLKSGSLQHLGENMLAFLLQIASSPDLSGVQRTKDEGISASSSAIYFDILGLYMVLYHQGFANILHNSVALQSLLIWSTSLLMGGYPAAVSLILSCLSIILMWIFSLSFSLLSAFILPLLSTSPVPYVASPWLVIGLFAAPALLGALTGQHLGFLILQMYLSNAYSKRKQLPPLTQSALIKLEAERWLYKAGSMQWLILLVIGNYYRIGSSYLALVWLVPPAFSYGFLEATLTPGRFPKPLKLATLLFGLSVPIVVSAGVFIRLVGTIIGMVVRLDRNPGNTPEWMANVIIAVFIALVISLTMVYLLSYVHLSGAKKSIFLAASVLFGLCLAAVLSGVAPPFTEDTARAVNVVHIVDATINKQEQPDSYVSFFSTTPGKLTKEVEQIGGGFTCGRDKVVDLVTFSVKYGCWSYDDTEGGWSKTDIPTLLVINDGKGDKRITEVSLDTKSSTRWVLAVNTEYIEDFKLEGNSEELIPLHDKSSVDGWHIIQFSGGKKSPTRFDLTLVWANSTQIAHDADSQKNQQSLLKLRTDMDRLTPKAEKVLMKLPPWCSLFGKSTSPHTLAFLRDLPVGF
ncbi:endoplasmic reticulum metallopeptidase 1 isoform X2 [Rhodamnia argentea]|uniref:Vacuolar membrane protease n=1 Tax=Rhodamnia argentea TaxID=178133 RepID=A0ABM3HEL7_9MYRT|nr:endoplasmic reticulum metallopeptidase 1 isoform X2 [Rhodamnia argentea]